MENIIVGFSEWNNGIAVKDMLVKSGFVETEICTSGDEVLRAANRVAGGIVVCGYKTGGMVYTEIYELLPDGFGMLVLLSGSQAGLIDSQDVFSLVLPVNKADLLHTINMILEIGRKHELSAKAPGRGQAIRKTEKRADEKLIIEKAKLLLMNKFNITEEAAHRFIQKSSMNKCIKMVETAEIILKEERF